MKCSRFHREREEESFLAICQSCNEWNYLKKNLKYKIKSNSPLSREEREKEEEKREEIRRKILKDSDRREREEKRKRRSPAKMIPRGCNESPSAIIRGT